jgi:hypothetical protein
MSDWKPISLSDLNIEIENGVKLMTKNQLELWKEISIRPEKWIEEQYGTFGGGFWVVAVYGNYATWYNDIEEGFNISSFSEYGKLDDYGAEQDELQWTINKLKRHHNTI